MPFLPRFIGKEDVRVETCIIKVVDRIGSVINIKIKIDI